mmetsp:Transcript_19608/g.35320  ORF Transcript_19608/g.35320 Transcript_19608/m.35320 type:complete len:383 (+) Transcript_19608:1-1149(+)
MEFYATQKGSFLWEMMINSNDKTGITANVVQPSFWAWFCTYDKAQKLLTSSHQLDADDDTHPPTTFDKCQALLQCRRYQKRLQFWWKQACTLLPITTIATTTTKGITPTAVTAATTGNNCEDASRILFECLAEVYHETKACAKPTTTTDTTDEDDHVSKILRRYLQRGANRSVRSDNGDDMNHDEKGDIKDQQQQRNLGEMVRQAVVLVDNRMNKLHQNKGDDGDDGATSTALLLQRGLEQMLSEMTQLTLSQCEYWTRRWMETNPLLVQQVFDNEQTLQNTRSTMDINLRRRVVETLSPSTQHLYSIMQDQLSIGEDEWFRAFGGSMQDFCIGVKTLEVCGLIQSKLQRTTTTRTMNTTTKKKRARVLYEKVSVVWCELKK